MRNICFLILSFIGIFSSCIKHVPLTKPIIWNDIVVANDSAWKDCSDRLYVAMQKQAHYLLGTVHQLDNDKNFKLLTEYGREEENIRPNVTALAGFCFLYKYGSYQEELVGVNKETLKDEYIIPMFRCMIRKHIMGRIRLFDRARWGGQFQSAHWAYIMAKGAFWMWSDLPEDIQKGILRIVSYEADMITSKQPPMQLVDDTKCEENAWNAQILAVAQLLMPNDDRYGKWVEAQRLWVVSSYIRPSDLKSDSIVDGVKLSQFACANIYDDYTLENHGLVHPDYMSSFILSAQMALDYKMMNKEIPDFLKFGITGLYDNLKYLTLPDGGLYYPSGQDWRIFRNADWILNHAIMAMISDDKDSWYFANSCMNTIEKMQQRNIQGNTYSEGEYFFSSTQQHLLFWWCNAWLAMQFDNNEILDIEPKLGVRDFYSGKIVINKTKRSVHSLSYGKNPMILLAVNGLDRVFSPEKNSGFGTITFANGKKSSAVIDDVIMESQDDFFEAELKVSYTDSIIGIYNVKSKDNILTVHEKLVARENCCISEIATSEFFLLNNPNWVYENGNRVIKTKDNSYCFNSSSGVSGHFSDNEIFISPFVKVSSKNNLYCRYQSSEKSQSARFVDSFSLNFIQESRDFLKDDVISDVEYTFEIIDR